MPSRPGDGSSGRLDAVDSGGTPVILAPDDEALWFDSAVTDPLVVLGCLRPYPTHEMEAYPVGPLVSSARNEGREPIEPLGVSQPRLWSL